MDLEKNLAYLWICAIWCSLIELRGMLGFDTGMHSPYLPYYLNLWPCFKWQNCSLSVVFTYDDEKKKKQQWVIFGLTLHFSSSSIRCLRVEFMSSFCLSRSAYSKRAGRKVIEWVHSYGQLFYCWLKTVCWIWWHLEVKLQISTWAIPLPFLSKCVGEKHESFSLEPVFGLSFVDYCRNGSAKKQQFFISGS